MWKFPSLYQRVEGNYVTRNREFMGQEGCVTKPCYFFIDLLVAAVVQSLSPVQFLATPWTEARQATLSFIISLSLFKLMSIESVMPSNHLILWHPLLPSVFPSIRLFYSELTLHIRWAKYWSFSFDISPSSEYSRLISFRIDWFSLFAIQGTLKSLQRRHTDG